MAPSPEPVPADTVDLAEMLRRGMRFAQSLTHDRSEAEDLLQDAATAMLVKGVAWEACYLFATIRNRFIDRCRRRKIVAFVSLDHGLASGEPREIPAPDACAVVDHFEGDRLHRALAALRDDERETLFLAAIEGFTAEEIARFSGRPRGTVLSVIFRAKRKLRATLEPAGGRNGASLSFVA